jgi:hypothetical protein
MVYDLSRIETRDLGLCETCKTKPRECDKFCRQCGARLGSSGETLRVSAASSSISATSPLSQDMRAMVTGRLAAAALTGISYSVAPLHNRHFKWLISALLSIPIWLIIVLLSPLDAYTTAKTISKQI